MKAGVPCSRYRSVAEAMADPQIAARGTFAELGEGDGEFLVANAPYLLSATPTAARPSAGRARRAHRRGAAASCLGRSPCGAESRPGPARRRASLRRGARSEERRSSIDAARCPAPKSARCCAIRCAAFSKRIGRPRGAVERAREPAAVASLWRGLAGQGLAALGSEPDEGGLRELAIVMEELGRAAAPGAAARRRAGEPGARPLARATPALRACSTACKAARRASPSRSASSTPIRRRPSSPGKATRSTARCASSTAPQRPPTCS